MSRSVQVSLEEWQVLDPKSTRTLAGLGLGDRSLEPLAAHLAETGRLEVLELARGLHVRSFQFVGRVTLGALEVIIRPKLRGAPLMRLLRHAYGLRQLELLDDVRSDAACEAFQDLLIHQLIEEASELLARGLHRGYVRQTGWLASPRGRIDFQGLARQQSAVMALPCVYHSRLEDNLLNQVLAAGLELAGRLAVESTLRLRARRLAELLSETVSRIRLEPSVLTLAEARLDRLTAAYRPAIALVRLLLEGAGVALEGDGARMTVPGFLFDMNRFFQALMSRFLRAHLSGYEVQDEWRLSELIRFVPGLNPRGRPSPSPRPDFAVLERGRVVALLDAKHRDLWTHRLPRDMLYQLSVYALSQGDGGRATILYPTLEPTARDQALQVRAPGSRQERARVVLRPVDLNRLDRLCAEEGVAAGRACAEYARQLVFGRDVGLSRSVIA